MSSQLLRLCQGEGKGGGEGGGKDTYQVMRKKNSVKRNGCVEGGGQGYASGNEE